MFGRRFRAHRYVRTLGERDDGVIRPLNKRSSQSCLSNVAVQYGKPLGIAIVLQNEILAYFQSHRSGRRRICVGGDGEVALPDMLNDSRPRPPREDALSEMRR